MKKRIAALIALALLSSVAVLAQVTVTISSQGVEAVKLATGYTPKTAVLARADVCNEGDAVSIATSRIAASIIAKEQYGIYSSQVVTDVLNVLQQRDIFFRAQKIVSAGANVVTLTTALFKTLAPLTVSIMQSAPAIAQAVLPAVGDPRDLAALGRQVMTDNAAIALGKKGAGNDCQTTLLVAMTGSIKTDVIPVQ